MMTAPCTSRSWRPRVRAITTTSRVDPTAVQEHEVEQAVREIGGRKGAHVIVARKARSHGPATQKDAGEAPNSHPTLPGTGR